LKLPAPGNNPLLEELMPAYQTCFLDDAVGVSEVSALAWAEQLLVGMPTKAGLTTRVWQALLWLVQVIISLICMFIAMVAPGVLRGIKEAHSSHERAPVDFFGACRVYSLPHHLGLTWVELVYIGLGAWNGLFILIVCSSWQMHLWFRCLHRHHASMNAAFGGLQGASHALVPMLRVGNYNDLLAWAEVRALVEAARASRKIKFETLLAVMVLTSLGILIALVWFATRDGWTLGLLSVLMSMVMFCVFCNTLPALVVGTQVNFEIRTTLGLLSEFAVQSETYAGFAESGYLHLQEGGTREVLQEAQKAASLARSLAMNLQMDHRSIVTILGMPLTIQMFVSAASAMSAAMGFALRSLHLHVISSEGLAHANPFCLLSNPL